MERQPLVLRLLNAIVNFLSTVIRVLCITLFSVCIGIYVQISSVIVLHDVFRDKKSRSARRFAVYILLAPLRFTCGNVFVIGVPASLYYGGIMLYHYVEEYKLLVTVSILVLLIAMLINGYKLSTTRLNIYVLSTWYSYLDLIVGVLFLLDTALLTRAYHTWKLVYQAKEIRALPEEHFPMDRVYLTMSLLFHELVKSLFDYLCIVPLLSLCIPFWRIPIVYKSLKSDTYAQSRYVLWYHAFQGIIDIPFYYLVVGPVLLTGYRAGSWLRGLKKEKNLNQRRWVCMNTGLCLILDLGLVVLALFGCLAVYRWRDVWAALSSRSQYLVKAKCFCRQACCVFLDAIAFILFCSLIFPTAYRAPELRARVSRLRKAQRGFTFIDPIHVAILQTAADVIQDMIFIVLGLITLFSVVETVQFLRTLGTSKRIKPRKVISHFCKTCLNIPVILCTFPILVTAYRVPMLTHKVKRAWAKGKQKPSSLQLEAHAVVIKELLNVLIDVTFILFGLIISLSFFRFFKWNRKIVTSKTITRRRWLYVTEAVKVALDVPTFALALVLLLPAYRIPALVHAYRTRDRNVVLSKYRIVLSHFFGMFLDAPFIALSCAVSLVPWRGLFFWRDIAMKSKLPVGKAGQIPGFMTPYDSFGFKQRMYSLPVLHTIKAVLDVLLFATVCTTVIPTGYRVPFVLSKFKHNITTNSSRVQPIRDFLTVHWQIFQQCISAACDVPFVLIAGVLYLIPYRRPKYLSKRWGIDANSLSQRYVSVVKEFVMALLDIVAAVFLVIIVVSQFRAPLLLRDLGYTWRWLDGQACARRLGSASGWYHEVVFKHMLFTLIELPWIACFYCTFWRFPNLWRLLYTAETYSERRSFALRQFLLMLADIPALACFIMTSITFWRARTMWTRLREVDGPLLANDFRYHKIIFGETSALFGDLPLVILWLGACATIWRRTEISLKLAMIDQSDGNGIIKYGRKVKLLLCHCFYSFFVDVFLLVTLAILRCSWRRKVTMDRLRGYQNEQDEAAYRDSYRLYQEVFLCFGKLLLECLVLPLLPLLLWRLPSFINYHVLRYSVTNVGPVNLLLQYVNHLKLMILDLLLSILALVYSILLPWRGYFFYLDIRHAWELRTQLPSTAWHEILTMHFKSMTRKHFWECEMLMYGLSLFSLRLKHSSQLLLRMRPLLHMEWVVPQPANDDNNDILVLQCNFPNIHGHFQLNGGVCLQVLQHVNNLLIPECVSRVQLAFVLLTMWRTPGLLINLFRIVRNRKRDLRALQFARNQQADPLAPPGFWDFDYLPQLHAAINTEAGNVVMDLSAFAMLSFIILTLHKVPQLCKRLFVFWYSGWQSYENVFLSFFKQMKKIQKYFSFSPFHSQLKINHTDGLHGISSDVRRNVLLPFLTAKDLCNVAAVSTVLEEEADSNKLWIPLLAKKFKIRPQKMANVNAKEMYKIHLRELHAGESKSMPAWTQGFHVYVVINTFEQAYNEMYLFFLFPFVLLGMLLWPFAYYAWFRHRAGIHLRIPHASRGLNGAVVDSLSYPSVYRLPVLMPELLLRLLMAEFQTIVKLVNLVTITLSSFLLPLWVLLFPDLVVLLNIFVGILWPLFIMFNIALAIGPVIFVLTHTGTYSAPLRFLTWLVTAGIDFISAVVPALLHFLGLQEVWTQQGVAILNWFSQAAQVETVVEYGLHFTTHTVQPTMLTAWTVLSEFITKVFSFDFVDTLYWISYSVSVRQAVAYLFPSLWASTLGWAYEIFIFFDWLLWIELKIIYFAYVVLHWIHSFGVVTTFFYYAMSFFVPAISIAAWIACCMRGFTTMEMFLRNHLPGFDPLWVYVVSWRLFRRIVSLLLTMSKRIFMLFADGYAFFLARATRWAKSAGLVGDILLLPISVFWMLWPLGLAYYLHSTALQGTWLLYLPTSALSIILIIWGRNVIAQAWGGN